MGNIIYTAIRALMGKMCPLGSLVLTFLTGLSGSGPWRKCNLKRSPNIQKCKAINMVSLPEVEVVDMVTTQDTSLITSLGEYFSPFPFVVLYHFHPVMF